MSTTERERQATEVEGPITEREHRARTLEAAALEMEMRGWAENHTCDDKGRVCMGGAIAFALGHDLPRGNYGMESPGVWEEVAAILGAEHSTEITRLNLCGPAAVTSRLRTRAQEIRDGR